MFVENFIKEEVVQDGVHDDKIKEYLSGVSVIFRINDPWVANNVARLIEGKGKAVESLVELTNKYEAPSTHIATWNFNNLNLTLTNIDSILEVYRMVQAKGCFNHFAIKGEIPVEFFSEGERNFYRKVSVIQTYNIGNNLGKESVRLVNTSKGGRTKILLPN